MTDAAILIRDLEPFRQIRPVWDRTAEMILLAATTGKLADIQEATRPACLRRSYTRTGAHRNVTWTLAKSRSAPANYDSCCPRPSGGEVELATWVRAWVELA